MSLRDLTAVFPTKKSDFGWAIATIVQQPLRSYQDLIVLSLRFFYNHTTIVLTMFMVVPSLFRAIENFTTTVPRHYDRHNFFFCEIVVQSWLSLTGYYSIRYTELTTVTDPCNKVEVMWTITGGHIDGARHPYTKYCYPIIQNKCVFHFTKTCWAVTEHGHMAYGNHVT